MIKMPGTLNKSRGFTLIELVLVITLLAIIGVVSAKLLATGFLASINVQNVTNADWQASIALERMARDIHEVRSANDITTATSSSLVFVDDSGTTITYQLSGSNLMRNSQILADGVSALTFSYFTNTGASTAVTSAIRYITINLTITLNNTNFSLVTSVNPRNLL